jgi:hypothetical protein
MSNEQVLAPNDDVSNPRSEASGKTGTSQNGSDGSANPKSDGNLNGKLNDITFLYRTWEWMFPSSVQRLRNVLPGFRQDLMALACRNTNQTNKDQAIDWKKPAINLLERAEEAVNAGNAEQGWQCLNAAARFMLHGLSYDRDGKRLLNNHAVVIANIAADDKKGLPRWRRESINTLLKDDQNEVKKKIKVLELVEAKRILDEHSDNVYRRLAILKSRLFLLSISGLIFLIVWLFILRPPVPEIVVARSTSNAPAVASVNAGLASASTSSPSPGVGIDTEGALAPSVSADATETSSDVDIHVVSTTTISTSEDISEQRSLTGNVAEKFWWTVVLAGLLGGLISAFTSTIGSDIRKSNIPTEISTQNITFARLMLASLSALAVTLFLTSGILSFGQLSYELIVAIAIASGFTERLLLRALNLVVNPS